MFVCRCSVQGVCVFVCVVCGVLELHVCVRRYVVPELFMCAGMVYLSCVVFACAGMVGCREVQCTSVEEVLYLLASGSDVRHTGATQMNHQSSRSHAIFTVVLGRIQPSTSLLHYKSQMLLFVPLVHSYLFVCDLGRQSR